MKRSLPVTSAALVALVTACTAPRVVVVPPQPQAEDPADRALDRAALARDLESTIRESYVSISGGYDEAYLDGLARDRRLVLIDVGPEDVLVGFDAKACAMVQQFEDHTAEIVTKRLEVHVSPDGTAAWSFDELSYRVLHEGRRVIIPMRSTGVYERRSGRWLLVQSHVSYGIGNDEVWDYAAGKHQGVPAPLENWTSPGDSAAAARALVERAASGAEVPVADGDAGSLVVGSDPDAEYRGPEALAHANLRSLYGDDKSYKLRDLRVKTSATGQLAWAAANVDVGGTVEGAPVTLPLRVTWVLELVGGTWRVVQVHASVPVPSSELSLRVFGSVVT